MIKDENIKEYLQDREFKNPLFLLGDSLEILKRVPNESIDCVITSSPYWGHRLYNGGGIGQENTYNEYISNLSLITNEVFRVLKKRGHFG